MEEMATADDGLTLGIGLETVHKTTLKAPACGGEDMADEEVTEGPFCSLEMRPEKIGGYSREAVDISPKLTTNKQLQLHQHKSSRSTKKEDSDDRDGEDDEQLSIGGQKLEVVIEQQHQSHKHLSARPRIWSSSSTVSSQDRSQIISRAPSMADSVVDYWTPALAGRGSIKSPAFRTVSLSNEHLNDAGEEAEDTEAAQEDVATLRLARPASRRGGLPVFDPAVIGTYSARGGIFRSMSDVSTEPPRDASSPWEQTPRASWNLSEDGRLEHRSRDDSGSPIVAGFGATFGRPLSPIQSVLSSCSASKAPYCLDDLRAREGRSYSEIEEGVSEEAENQGKSKSAPGAAIVSRRLGQDATSSSPLNGNGRSGRSRSRRPIPRIAPDENFDVGGTKRTIPPSSSFLPFSDSVDEEKDEAPAARSSVSGTGTSVDVRDSMRSTSTALTDVQTFEKPPGSSSPVLVQGSSHTSSSSASFTTGEAASSSPGPPEKSDSDDPFSYGLSESEKRKLYEISSPDAPDSAFVSASIAADGNSKNDGITDNRISPFYADNASVWKAAAAAAAIANGTTASLSHARAGAHWRKSSRSLLDELRASRTNNFSSDDDDVADGGAMAVASSRPSSKKGLSNAIWQSVRQMGIFQRQARVESARIVPRPPAPESLPPQPSASVKTIIPTPIKNPYTNGFNDVVEEELMFAERSKNNKLARRKVVPAFGEHGPLTKTPMISPFGTDICGKSYDEDDTASSTSGTDSPSPGKAQVRAEGAEGGVEDGGLEMTRVRVEAQLREVSWAEVAEAARQVLATVSDEETIVLPCAPTEEEKVLYYDSGRFLVIPCALVSFITLSTGTWLFTIVHPAFYWFGLPSAFLMFYLGCHYLGVAIWGKDFSPEKHAEIVQESERQGYEPSVDVFLPVCKEPAYLLANTWKHVWALDYPNYTVHVLDDGDKAEVKALADAFGFNYMVRPDRPALKKAGNLRHAFSQTSGDLIAIFDADFCPRQDFLKETIPYLGQDASIGIVQTPQFFRYRDEQTWVEKGAGITQEFFYRLVQVNQDRFHAAVCVGSCGVYRRTALEPFGGMAAIGHSEDMYTGFKMTELGYRIKYVPLPLAMGTCPDEHQSFFMQQYRWAMGSATLVMEKEFWRSNISSIHKLCFLNGMLYYMATALMLFLTPIPFLMLVWINADEVLWYHAAFTLPAIVFAAGVMPLWCTQRYGMACHRVRVIQCYAHLYAIKDRLMGRSAPWVPSGSSASRGASATFKSSVYLLVIWNVVTTVLVVGGCIWRMTDFTWYHFVPAIVITLGGFILSVSTLFA